MEQSKLKLRRYLRADHVQGVGLVVPRGGREAHSIAWADGEHQYAIPEWLGELGITELDEPDQIGPQSDQIGPVEGDPVPVPNSESIPPAEQIEPVVPTEPLPNPHETPTVSVEVDPVAEVEATEPVVLPTEESETSEPVSDAPSDQPAEPVSEAAAIREYLLANGIETPTKKVIADLAAQGVKVTSSQVSRARAQVEAA